MGGYNSGRYQSYSAKGLVEHAIENAPALTISLLVHKAGLGWDKNGSGTMRWENGSLAFQVYDNLLTLVYTLSTGPNAGVSPCVRIPIVSTYPNYGGRRLWLLCPTCKRRCAKLYRPYGQVAYACRECSNLTYASTRQETQAEERARLFKEVKRFDRQLAYRRERVERLLANQ